MENSRRSVSVIGNREGAAHPAAAFAGGRSPGPAVDARKPGAQIDRQASPIEVVAAAAQRDSARAPAAPLLGAFGEGRLLAALSLREGNLIADPFVRTAELREVLEWRAAHLRNRPRGRLRRLFGRISRGALPASPPGAGGRLLELTQRRSL